MKEKLKLSVLVSGGGTNLQALIDSMENGGLPGTEIALVLSSRVDAFALKRAERAGIKTVVVSNKGFPDEAVLADEIIKNLEAAGTELVVLAGYMSILHPNVIRRFSKRIINIHPSLIPKYCGKGFYGLRVHRAVIEAGEKVSGATVHFVDEGVDTGEIILQREVPVEAGDDEHSLAARVLEVEHVLLPEAVSSFIKSGI